jgi:ankyrin repeat protein
MLFNAGCSVNATGLFGTSPLESAVSLDSTELVRALLSHGANVNQPSAVEPGSVLQFAKSPGMVDLLIHSGVDVNNGSPLESAIDHRNTAVLAALINHGANVNSSAKWPAYSILMRAVRIGDIDAVTLLLQKGADVNYATSNGQTALSIANDPGITALLTSHGAKRAAPRTAQVQNVYYNPSPNGQLTNALTFAVQRHDVDAVKAALAADPALINKADNSGLTPIDLLLRSYYQEDTTAFQICQILISSGADLKSRDQAGDTPLHYAARSGSASAVQLLLDRGAPVNATNNNGDTPLFGAQPGAVSALISHGADFQIVDKLGITPLLAAARSGAVASVTTLIAAGAKPGLVGPDGDQTINVLLGRPDRTIPSVLFSKSNLGLVGNYGLTAIEQVFLSGNNDLLKQLMLAQPTMNPFSRFLLAVVTNKPDVVRKDLSLHPEYASQRLADGAVALHIASLWNSTAAATVLFEAGADIEARDANGDTPLQWCAQGKGANAASTDFASFLLAHHADVNSQNVRGYGTLQSSVTSNGSLPMIQLLLQNKADPNLRDNDGLTLLHFITDINNQSSTSDVLSLLVKNGADLNAFAWRSEFPFSGPVTPLEYAATQGRNNFVTAFIKQGANINVVGADGNTPLFAAIRCRNADVVSSLIDAGANVNAVNNQGQTPLDVAGGEYGSSQLVDMLTSHGAKKGEAVNPTK